MIYSPAGIYLLKVNNRNTRTRCEICSRLTIQTPEQCQWCRSLLSLFLSVCLPACLPAWLTGCLAGCLADWMAGCLGGCLADWLAGWLTGWLAGRLTDWLTDWLTPWFNMRCFPCPSVALLYCHIHINSWDWVSNTMQSYSFPTILPSL